jgi:hypothetical protein
MGYYRSSPEGPCLLSIWEKWRDGWKEAKNKKRKRGGY